MSELLELKNISMSFEAKSKLLEGEKRLKVLRNINLDVHEGEIVVVVGESGCGKTTIGKIITGLLKPSGGQIIFNGKNVYQNAFAGLFSRREKFKIDENIYKEELDKLDAKARAKRVKQIAKQKSDEYKMQVAEFENSVQFVQQDSYAALNPARTIYQSLYSPIKNKHKKWTRRQINGEIAKLLALVGLSPVEQYLFKFPHQLSGGQRQRILMARAVSLRPKLIVADEPVSMIDVSLRLSILDLMKELNKKLNLSFVYITHDLSTARYIGYSGRICVMYLGEIVEMGSVNDIVASPAHPYTQALFSAVPIPDPEISRKTKPINIKSMEVGNLLDRKNGCPFFARCPYAKDDCENQKFEPVMKGNVKVLCKHLEEVPDWVLNQ